VILKPVKFRDNHYILLASFLPVDIDDLFDSFLHIKVLDLLDELATLDLNEGKQVFCVELK